MSMPAEILRHELTLQQLLAGFVDAPPLQISGITDDSRSVEPGDAFLAWQGVTAHGLQFVDAAMNAGAAAIVWDADTGDESLCYAMIFHLLRSTDWRAIWAKLRTAGTAIHPQAVKVIGVTGTNGKTTVAYLIAQCLNKLDHECAYIGTLGSDYNELHTDLGVTTPPCLELHRQIAMFRDAGASLGCTGGIVACASSESRQRC